MINCIERTKTSNNLCECSLQRHVDQKPEEVCSSVSASQSGLDAGTTVGAARARGGLELGGGLGGGGALGVGAGTRERGDRLLGWWCPIARVELRLRAAVEELRVQSVPSCEARELRGVEVES